MFSLFGEVETYVTLLELILTVSTLTSIQNILSELNMVSTVMKLRLYLLQGFKKVSSVPLITVSTEVLYASLGVFMLHHWDKCAACPLGWKPSYLLSSPPPVFQLPVEHRLSANSHQTLCIFSSFFLSRRTLCNLFQIGWALQLQFLQDDLTNLTPTFTTISQLFLTIQEWPSERGSASVNLLE